MQNKHLLNKIAEELFFMAKQLGMAMGDIAFTPYGRLRLKSISRDKYNYSIKKYQKYGLLRKTTAKHGSVFIITEKAKLLRAKPSQKTRRPDGLSTVVLFDITEEKRKARDTFRRYLIRNGYTQIQKSVFISPFMIFDELLEIVKELGIESNVTFISGRIDRF